MPSHASVLTRFASLVSTLGHPLLTTSLFILIVTFHLFDRTRALISSLIILGVVILPITFWNFRQTRRGKYTNFDVSDRSQRKSFYRVLIGFLIIATVCLFVTRQPMAIVYGMGFALVLVVLSYVVNFYIKASLHTSLSFFLAGALFTLTLRGGLLMALLAVVIAFSRWILRRHTIEELMVGATLGILTGGSMHWALSQLKP